MNADRIALSSNGTRTAILQAIKLFPGIHFRALQRMLGIANGSLQYHLDVLEDQGLVRRFKGYGYTRFYPLECRDINPKAMSVVTHPTVERILDILLQRKEITLKEVSEMLGISTSTALWHLRRLENAGVVTKDKNGKTQGRKHVYKLRNEKEVETMLKNRRLSLLDKLSNNWIELWSIKL